METLVFLSLWTFDNYESYGVLPFNQYHWTVTVNGGMGGLLVFRMGVN